MSTALCRIKVVGEALKRARGTPLYAAESKQQAEILKQHRLWNDEVEHEHKDHHKDDESDGAAGQRGRGRGRGRARA